MCVREKRTKPDATHFALELVPVHQIEMKVVLLEEVPNKSIADAEKTQKRRGEREGDQRESRRVPCSQVPSRFS